MAGFFSTLGESLNFEGLGFRRFCGLPHAKDLLTEEVNLTITDPKALKNADRDLQNVKGKVHLIEDPYKAAKECDAIAIMTEWDLYKNLDYEKIFEEMNKPAFVFDGRNIVDHKRLYEIGFNVYPTGKCPMVHL